MSRLRLLVVDDANFIRDFIRKGLRAKFPDFTIDDAVNGRQAQQFLKKDHYDIVLCDWEMPEMTGLELLAWVRGHAEMAKMPFIMVTSRGDRDHVVKAIQSGADSYIVKPFTIDGLIAKVAAVLKKGGVPTTAPAKAPQGPAADSVAILTGGAKPAAPKRPSGPAADSVAILTGGGAAKPAAAKPGAKAPMPTARLRFGDQTVRSVIKDIKLVGLELVIRREDPLPPLLEPVVVDIEASQVNETLRMNAFVHAIRAGQPSLEATQYLLSVTFADDDPVKNENLTRFITTLRGL